MILRVLTIPIFLFLISLGTANPIAASGNAALSKIALANDYYAKTQYKEAVNIYQQLVDGGNTNGYLYFNLGNAYLRIGKTGPAILNYVRAKKFLPRDESLDANLRHAILKTEDQLEPPASSGVSSVFFWANNFSQTEHLIFLGIINLLFWLILGIWFVNRSEFWNVTRKTILALLLISVLSVGAKIYLEAESTPGVILVQTIEVKSAIGTENVTLFQLNEGSVVSIIQKNNDWYQIELNDGKKGWVQKGFIGT